MGVEDLDWLAGLLPRSDLGRSPGPSSVSSMTLVLALRGVQPWRGGLEIGFSTDTLEELASFHHEVMPGNRQRPKPGEYRDMALKVASELASRIIFTPTLRRIPDSTIAPDPAQFQERAYDGSSLLADLLQWYLPTPDSGDLDSSKAAGLNDFVSAVFKQEVRVWPSLTEGIRVYFDDSETRKLDDLGLGVAQVLTIAASLAKMDVAPILLLEEPEVCLHPGLQRQLVAHLGTLEIQTLITTHSNHLIDNMGTMQGANIYHIRYDQESKARTVSTINSDAINLLSDLGVSASSISAANAVIWVEGPSDAMYIRYWLQRHKDGSTLTLWQDFAFAFHGGALLAHHGTERASLVDILRIHPGFFVVADSDRTSPNAEPKHSYLHQLLQEIHAKERIWVTHPKEIEGYLSDIAITGKAQPSNKASDRFSSLKKRLKALGQPPSLADRKVILAQQAIKHMDKIEDAELFAESDLNEKIEKLASFIRECRHRIPALAV